jgi:hypothetical protein
VPSTRYPTLRALGAPLPLLGILLLALAGSISLDELPIVLLGGFDDALPGETTCAEGCHEGAVLAAQSHYVWVRLVEVVVELGKPELFRLYS